MIEPVISGQLKVMVSRLSYIILPCDSVSSRITLSFTVSLYSPALIQLGEDLNCWQNVYGVLKGQSLLCYQCQEELESEDEPLLVIHLKKVGVGMSTVMNK